MPIKEKSFRIGCGRYLQENGIISALGEEVKRLGTAPIVVGGKTALSITKNAIEGSLGAACDKYEIIEHRRSCNEEDAQRLATLAQNKGLDVIVGVGGGVIMDFSKLIGYYAKLPVINVPTSSATCAAYTPLSVRYTPDGRTVGSLHYGYEVNAVIADSKIIATQPNRLLISGIFDSLAKFIEIKQRFNEECTEYPLGLDWAYTISVKSFKKLVEDAEKCIDDIRAGNITNTVEQIIFNIIAVTGVISGIARGSNQTALAHKFYEGTRAMFFEKSCQYLHGEIVGVGLLLQNFFNGEPENNDFLLSLMKRYNMPCCIEDVGIPANDTAKKLYFEKLKSGSAIDENNPEELKKLQEGLDYLWQLK
ncbi:MAG: iron-containing alcohol dehydrogenase [Clostridia bacterium]|nr:iron-containing alcohol dehydrogenase [Clostridia bacterium]